MLDGLAEIPGMTLYGITDPARAGERTPTFTFTLPGITPRAGLRAAAPSAASSAGTATTTRSASWIASASRATAERCRLGFLRYTTEEEVDRTLEAIGEIARG